MDWSLIIFVVVVLWFGFRGYHNGLLKSISRILSLVAGYGCAILFTNSFASVVGSQLGLQGMIGIMVASMILFFGASILVGLLFWVVARLVFEQQPPSTASHIGGAVVGSLMGVLFAIIIVWALSFAREMNLTGKAMAPAPAAAESSGIEAMASRVTGSAVSAALAMGPVDAEVARFGSALLESPAEIAQHGQRLMEGRELKALVQNPANQRVLSRGDAAAVQALPEFQALAQNPDLRAIARAAGLDEQAARNGRSVDAELAQQMVDIWGRTERIKHHPRVQEIVSDPAFQQRLQSGDPMDLLNSAELLELTGIVFSDEAAPGYGGSPSSVSTSSIGAASSDSGSSEKTTAGAGAVAGKTTEKKLYRWKDDSGRIYYSDQKPESAD